MKIRWKKVLYYFLAFDLFLMIKGCNLPSKNDATDSEKSNKENRINFTLSGLVTKNDSITPIPFCDVTLFDLDSMVIAKTTADFNGCYSFLNIPPQNYIIRFSTIGFKTNFIEIILQSDTNIKTSLQLKEDEESQSITVIMCYDIVAFVDDSTFEANKNATDDFFNGISNKHDSIIEEKKSDVNDSLIE